jgi:MFS family permease
MTRVVLIFGLLAGAVLSVMMVVQATFIDEIGFDRGEVIGYTTMIVAFLMVFFGIRSYRDDIYGGTITFCIGLLITLVASVCYVMTWEVIYYWFAPDFVEKYGAYVIEQARQAGATEQELVEKTAEMARFREMYKNPLINAGITLIEVFPVGLVVTVVSAAILRRDRSQVPVTSESRRASTAS